MTRNRNRPVALLAVLGLASSLAGCGSTNNPAGPSQAIVTATFANVVVGFSPLVQFNNRLEFDLTLRESAGVGFRVNFIRADFRDVSGAVLERQEAGAIQFDHIPAGGSQVYHVVFDFNTNDAQTALVTVNMTDDKGNVLQAQVTVTG